MAQRANITLTDAATTPVNRVYQPVRSTGDILFWQDRTNTILLGQNRLSVFQRPADKKSNATKVVWKLETPVLATVSGASSAGYAAEPKVSHTPVATIEFVLPAKSTQQERKDLLAQIRDLLGEAILTAQVQDQDLIY